jgi:hypothetical protein
VQFEITETTRDAVAAWINRAAVQRQLDLLMATIIFAD